jgi:hypothetical protein
MEKKTFVLGIGAQKSGTSWLYNYLKVLDSANLGFTKEYHIWDALYVPECKNFKLPLRTALSAKVYRSIWLMQTWEKYYFDYFTSLLNSATKNLTADITPSYSALETRVFRKILSGFAQRDVDCKVVFLMRDPVDRCLSAVAMQKRNGDLPQKSDYSNDVILYSKSRQSEIRTNYKGTVKRVEKAFTQCAIYYGIFEEMFEIDNIYKLSNFLGVSPQSDLANIKLNASEQLPVDHCLKREIAQHYKEVYEFAAHRFPKTLELWQGFKYI